jgi:hypothetical protein
MSKSTRLHYNASGELVIYPDTWHFRRYNYWRRHAEFKAEGYRENKCHYWRVALFWSQLTWLFYARLGPVAPGHVLGALSFVALLMLPNGWLVITVFAISLIFVYAWLDRSQKRRVSRKFDEWFPRPDALLSKSTNVTDWFFYKRYAKGVYPWTVLWYLSVIVFLIVDPLFTLKLIGVCIAVLIGLVLIIILVTVVGMLGGVLMDYLAWYARRFIVDESPRSDRPVFGNIQVVKSRKQRLLARFHGSKLCPYVTFAKEDI